MANQLPVRFWSWLACLAVGTLLGCRDFVSVNPVGSGVTPAPPEPPQLRYRIKRVISGGCSGSGIVSVDFSYAKDLFVAQTSYPNDVRERGTPNCRYNYDAASRLQSIAIDGKEPVGKPTGQHSYTYTPTTIIEQFEARYPDGRQEVSGRNTYTLSGGLIVSCKQQYYDTGVPLINQVTYEYTNGNVTRVITKGQYGQVKRDVSHEYDNKPNPFYRNATYNWVGSGWTGILYVNFSRNNIVKSLIHSPYDGSVVTVRTNHYTYNEQGLPLTDTRDDDGCQTARYEYETY